MTFSVEFLKKYKCLFVPLSAFFCLHPWINPPLALFLGIVIALLIGNDFVEQTRKATKLLLSLSIVGLGAGMNLNTVSQVGIKGISYTAIGITLTMILGIFIGRLMKTDKETSVLLSVGTAICGGSAIAAIGPVINARAQSMSIALGVVFILNALALFIFPWIGNFLGLSQTQFGLWSALAIHDTSSVVGAAMKYGPESLEVGTTVKLARALWIIPLAIAFQFFYNCPKNHPEERKKRQYPWFILGFLVMSAIFTWAPDIQNIGQTIVIVAKRTFVVCLFLIGTGLTLQTLRQMGYKTLLQGVILWLIVASTTLLCLKIGLIG